MGKVNKMDLSIIILSYQSQYHLSVLLPSVWKSEDMAFTASSTEQQRFSAEVIVVDNGSTDGTTQWLESEVEKNNNHFLLSLIKNKNTGFAAGNNLGIKKAQGRYALLLNPDTELQPQTLSIMLKFMDEHPEVGIGGCKIIKPDGTLDLACRRRFPNPWNSFSRLFLRNNTDYNYTNIDPGTEMEVDSVVGAFLMVRRTVLDKIGLLDEAFFMYGEDLDYCWRCKDAGYKVWYYPKTYITHFKGASSRKAPYKMLKAFHNAMWIFYRKHYAAQYPPPFNWFVSTGIQLRFGMLVSVNFFRKNKRVSG